MKEGQQKLKKLLKVYYDYEKYSDLIDYKMIEDTPENRENIKWDHISNDLDEEDMQEFIDGEVDEVAWESKDGYRDDPLFIRISLLDYEQVMEHVDKKYEEILKEKDKEKAKIAKMFGK